MVEEVGSEQDQWLLEALRTTEARFRAICEAAPLGIYASEIPQGVVYVNPALERIFGRPAEALLDEGWKRSLHPDDGDSVLAQRAAHYDASQPMRISGISNTLLKKPFSADELKQALADHITS